MKVYQGCIDYFFGHTSGYGTVRTHFGNVFSTVELCVSDLEKTIQSYNIKDWYIYQYDLDKPTKPILVCHSNQRDS